MKRYEWTEVRATDRDEVTILLLLIFLGDVAYKANPSSRLVFQKCSKKLVVATRAKAGEKPTIVSEIPRIGPDAGGCAPDHRSLTSESMSAMGAKEW
ncbi:hypothetical protein AG1IA_10020 [Rhizoctonia solani AG-1 IA]|uniref:Uncharacterized protein n=1 Tax=Thanatephorus cucumeris (strain AG1-IA) TaxID=983506 RepID=L8WDB1_THACA|nr:hypothetical protein AG1IA_10020 [Rhizoctonia solani AG-1 IA]